MAIDQEAMDEHVRVTGRLDNVDEFMGEYFRELPGMDRNEMERQPRINETVTRRCNISMTRPTTVPGVSPLERALAIDQEPPNQPFCPLLSGCPPHCYRKGVGRSSLYQRVVLLPVANLLHLQTTPTKHEATPILRELVRPKTKKLTSHIILDVPYSPPYQ